MNNTITNLYVASDFDCNPCDSSGASILIYDTINQCYTAYYSTGYINDSDKEEVLLYRFDVSKSIDSWINLQKISSFTGQDYSNLITIEDYYHLYCDIGSYYGFNNLDGYPDVLTFREVDKLWDTLNKYYTLEVKGIN